MEHYEILARFYDALLAERAPRTAKFIETIIREERPDAKTLLEIGCGTGNILTELSHQYDVSGLDLSEHMLDVFRRKLPDVPFYRQDMAALKLDHSYDVIICIFDALNHLPDYDQWVSTFRRVHDHLEPGGIFIVDFFIPGHFERYLRMQPSVFRFGERREHCALREAIARGENALSWHFTIFEHQGEDRYTRLEDDIRESAYPLETITQDLQSIFSDVRITTDDGSPPTGQSPRIYAVCRK